ncbi:class I SAM-dependent methyltransferase [Nocardiopsis suaedae]|uniref:Class I SAM-dependent methyltransferase n=1 Tax=Nocardiopsis suaedae TaxID=3018444 RepID=A0ABT4TQ99_9ACTN|nr:class I SAM-dependent methyltransferase [Nocardiopsis suaedae]MDA2806860.1 class I SAM-dependent methyltransferase [Nocardiopsis suaedae]
MSGVAHGGDTDTGAGLKAGLAGLFDRSAPTYERVGVEHFADLGRRLVAHAGMSAGQRVLDAGCGTGAALVPAALAVGAEGEAVGVDLSPGMVARARAEVDRLGLSHARAVVGDAETVTGLDGVPTAPGSFDTVLAGISLFFFPRPRAAVARYRELLRPGGRLAVSWWGPQDPRWEPVFAASAPYGTAGSSHRLPEDSPFRSVEALHGVLTGAGFTGAETVEEDCVTRFADAEHWWRWVWSTAARGFWESVPEERRQEAVAAVNRELFRLQAPDGSLTSSVRVRFTVARRA